MTNEEKDVEFIEKYLEGKLTPEQITDFEKRLAVDGKFKNSYSTYKLLIQGIKYTGKKNLIQKLKNVEAGILEEETSERRFLGLRQTSFYVFSAAASVLVLLTFTFLFLLNPSRSSQEIFDEYYQAYPNVVMPTTRGEIGIEGEVKKQAFYAYDQQDYKKAASLFERILKEERAPEVLLYLGSSYLALKKYNKAINTFTQLKAINSEYNSQTNWFLALAYLGNNDIAKAKEVLVVLKNGESSYSKKAESILKSL